jgi:hypothetical protein
MLFVDITMATWNVCTLVYVIGNMAASPSVAIRSAFVSYMICGISGG